MWRLFDDVECLRRIAEALVEPFRGVGTAAALALGVGFVPVRKAAGLFPGPKAVVESEADYRGVWHTLRVQRAALTAQDRVLLVDDWIETGSQARAAKRLIECCGASFVGVAAVASELEPDPVELRLLHALVRRDELPAS